MVPSLSCFINFLSIILTTIAFIRTIGKLIEVVFLLKFLLTFAIGAVVD